jgi:carbonic anhydrase
MYNALSAGYIIRQNLRSPIMHDLKNLFDNNRAWARDTTERDPGFFSKLSHQQSPEYMWIGCSDSRVPANEIVGLLPGEMFVHRNVANVVVHSDLNCLSVIQYAVEVLKVKHIIVCGHYGCGGIQAALRNSKLGLIDNWLRHVQDVAQKHGALMSGPQQEALRLSRLCELNVIEQTVNVCQTTVVQNAWERGQQVAVHGWIYGLADGLLQELHPGVGSQQQLDEIYATSLRRCAGQ